MKRTFITCTNGKLTSSIVSPDIPNALNIGDRIITTRRLDIGYDTTIEAGETGTVDYIDAPTGLTEILMDRYHRGLHRWHNHMWLEPFGTEDIIDGVSKHGRNLYDSRHRLMADSVGDDCPIA